MDSLDKSFLLNKLNELMEIEYKEILGYSTAPTCSDPRKGCEILYNYHKKKIRLIQSVKDHILFSFSDSSYSDNYDGYDYDYDYDSRE